MEHKIHIVLVGSLYSRNVGSVSRAMANMGAGRLILIYPKCEINHEARQGAAGAQTRLMEATIYSSWSDFFSTELDGLRIAFSARKKIDTDPLPLADRLSSLAALITPTFPLYLIFGPEDCGLSNEDVEYANYICQLPVYGEFKSFNLSHAVLLAVFIAQNSLNITINENQNTKINNPQKFYFPDSAIKEWLKVLGFEFGERRTDVYKILKRLFLTSASSAKEFRILEAVINQTIRKLKS